MLRIGFIGAGRIADMHYEGYRNNPVAKLYALCDTDSELLQQRAEQWNVDKTYEDYKKLLDNPEIEAVEIITPHHLHKQMTIDALDAGKHVSVQKPMALNIIDADAMITAAKRSGTLFRVTENYRYYPPFNKAKELLDEGEIGEPVSIRIKSLTGNKKYGWEIPAEAQSWRSDRVQSGDGSIIFDHGQHIWSIARYFLGDVESAFAFVGSGRVEAFHELRPGSFLDNPIMASWKYRGSDMYGSWEGIYSDDMVVHSKYYPIYVWLEITGTKGLLLINHFIGEKLDRSPLEMYRDGEMTSFTDLDADYATSFARAGRDFTDAILDGRQSDLTGTEGREVLRFSLSIIRSGEEHREVSVDEITD